jgi:tRNA-dihydrouridine synthase 2
LGTVDYVTARDYSLVLSLRPDETPRFILQIGTCAPDTACEAVARLLPDISGIDVNMGCPKAFSTSGGMGSALMKTPEKAYEIMKALVEKFG